MKRAFVEVKPRQRRPAKASACRRECRMIKVVGIKGEVRRCAHGQLWMWQGPGPVKLHRWSHIHPFWDWNLHIMAKSALRKAIR